MQYTVRRTEHITQSYIEPELSAGEALPLQMMLIPEGQFIMGSPAEELNSEDDERPQHLVRVPSFFMGRYPVTQAQWRAVAELPVVDPEIEFPPDPSEFEGENNPVEQVDWYQANEFCKRLEQATKRPYRLPSEAEWEYACRSVTREQLSVISGELTVEEWNQRFCRPFYFGKTLTDEVANYYSPVTYDDGPKGKAIGQTTPVDHFGIANGFGLSDMHGNVREWCADHWHDSYKDAPIDGNAWIEGGDSNLRMLRGGSWLYDPRLCRSAYRVNFTPGSRYNAIGFRVVCSAPGQSSPLPS